MLRVLCVRLFFFFSSRRRHTRFDCDWSSDVCSSDLMFVTGPNVVKTVTHEEVDFESLGGADVHGATSGVAHFVHGSERESLAAIRMLLSYLPSNNLDDPPIRPSADPADRRDEELLDVVPDEPTKP